MVCPKCGKTNPSYIRICACGWDIDSKVAPEPVPEKKSFRDAIVKKPVSGVEAK